MIRIIYKILYIVNIIKIYFGRDHHQPEF